VILKIGHDNSKRELINFFAIWKAKRLIHSCFLYETIARVKRKFPCIFEADVGLKGHLPAGYRGGKTGSEGRNTRIWCLIQKYITKHSLDHKVRDTE